MPYYTIHHLIPLTVTQKDTLAAKITDLHSTHFQVLRNFVNVRFQQLHSTDDIYIGGQRRVTNHILAHVRSGPSRSPSDWNALCAGIQSAWDEIVVNDPAPRAKGSGGGEEELGLRGIFLLGTPLGGMEAGVLMPVAGGDGEWMERQWGDFLERAGRGEREWVENVRDARERGLVDEGNAGKVSGDVVRLCGERLC